MYKCKNCGEEFPYAPVFCNDCGSPFNAMTFSFINPLEKKCVAGCKSFEGGEIRHHKDCSFYPESFSKMYDDLKSKSYTEQEVIDLFARYEEDVYRKHKANITNISTKTWLKNNLK